MPFLANNWGVRAVKYSMMWYYRKIINFGCCACHHTILCVESGGGKGVVYSVNYSPSEPSTSPKYLCFYFTCHERSSPSRNWSLNTGWMWTFSDPAPLCLHCLNVWLEFFFSFPHRLLILLPQSSSLKEHHACPRCLRRPFRRLPRRYSPIQVWAAQPQRDSRLVNEWFSSEISQFQFMECHLLMLFFHRYVFVCWVISSPLAQNHSSHLTGPPAP